MKDTLQFRADTYPFVVKLRLQPDGIFLPSAS
jgi:hypothetical protein